MFLPADFWLHSSKCLVFTCKLKQVIDNKLMQLGGLETLLPNLREEFWDLGVWKYILMSIRVSIT